MSTIHPNFLRRKQTEKIRRKITYEKPTSRNKTFVLEVGHYPTFSNV
jgi:hypothetical protein